MDKVSVVIPTYNRMDIVCDAIDSVLGQTYPNIEVVVVDDGSTDKTSEVLEKYGNKITVILQANRGCSAARNRGIKSCTGEYIAFLDSDDKWFPTKIEKQLALLDRAGKDAPCCWCNLLVESEGCVLDRLSIDHLHPKHREGLWLNPIDVLATRFVLFNQAVIVRREALERAGCFDESLWVMEDYDFAIRLALQGPWAYTSESLVICRERSNNRISKQAYASPLKLIDACIQVYDKHLGLSADHYGKALRHLKINRYFCVLDKRIHRLSEQKGKDPIIRKITVVYAKILKILYRRMALWTDMKTLPLHAAREFFVEKL